MELGAFTATLVRRWYLVVMVAALAVGACAFMVSFVGPTYEARSSVVLFPPGANATTIPARVAAVRSI